MKHGSGGWIGIGIVLLGISVASWVFQPVQKTAGPQPPTAATSPPTREPRRSEADLLKVAKQVGRLAGGENATYFWRSDAEVVSLQPSRDQPALFHLTVLNTHTGREQPLQSFNEAFGGLLRGHRIRVTVVGRPGATLTYEPPVASLSPEGRSFLWFGGRLFWHAATLNGEAAGRWRQPSPLRNQAVWLRDGHRWAEVETDLREGRYYLRRVHLHDLRDPRAGRTVETPALEDGFALGFTPEEKLLVRHGGASEATADTAEAEEIALTEVGLAAERGQLDRFTFRLPEPARMVECALSPAGDRLAWVLRRQPDSTGQSPYYSLWTCGPRGETMVQAGSMGIKHEAAARNTVNGIPVGPQSLRWLPDGKRVSFRLRDRLYVLPVD